MVVPLAARWAAAACGIVLILTGWQSVIGTLIVPRPVASWLTRSVDRLVLAVYRTVTRPVTDYVRRDRILATQAAATLVTQLGVWLGIFLAGFTLALWPSPGRNLTTSLADAGSSLFTLGFAEPPGTTPAVIVFIAAATGMTVIALQIGYLPTLAPPTRSPPRSTRFPRCGQGRAGTARSRSRPGGRPRAASAHGDFGYMICH